MSAREGADAVGPSSRAPAGGEGEGQGEVNCGCFRTAKRIEGGAGAAFHVCAANECGFFEPAPPRPRAAAAARAEEGGPPPSSGPAHRTYEMHVRESALSPAATLRLSREPGRDGWLAVKIVPVARRVVDLIKALADDRRHYVRERGLWEIRDDAQTVLELLKLLRGLWEQAGGARVGSWLTLTPYGEWRRMLRGCAGGDLALLALATGIHPEPPAARSPRRSTAPQAAGRKRKAAATPPRSQPVLVVDLTSSPPDADGRRRAAARAADAARRRRFVDLQQAAVDRANREREGAARRAQRAGPRRSEKPGANGAGAGADAGSDADSDEGGVEVCEAVTLTQAVERRMREAEANGELLVIE